MDSTDRLAADIATHIAGEDADGFEPLALRVFAYQFERNLPYRRFCDGRGVTPNTVTRWQDIPVAPAAAFKRFVLSCVDPELCTPEHGGRVFHSSGTTGSETSRHYMDAAALELYRLSARESYEQFVPGWSASIQALMPSTEDAPHSSLSFMLETLDGQFKLREHWTEALSLWFHAQKMPYTVFGTALAFLQLFEAVPDRFTLPEGCTIIETGGFKGQSSAIAREELYGLFVERLGVPLTRCIAEYGMTEMASQFYDTTLLDREFEIEREPRKAALPHLVRTRIIDPTTNEDAEPGQPGLLTHYDIANLNSVLAIQTEDYGHAMPGGDGFVLLGRAPGAALRGCSLTAEEFAARQ